MVREIIWTVTAYKDLQNIVQFIEEDSFYDAMSFYDEVINKANTLKEFPLRGRVVPETDDPNKREIFIHKYRMMYQLENKNVIITTVIHGAKDFSA